MEYMILYESKIVLHESKVFKLPFKVSFLFQFCFKSSLTAQLAL